MLCVCQVASFLFDTLWPYGLQPTRLLCPWDSPGKGTRVGCHALPHGIFPTQEMNPNLLQLLHCRWVLYHSATQEAHISKIYVSYLYIPKSIISLFPKDLEIGMGWELGWFLQFVTEICQPSNHFATYCCLLISHPLSDSDLRVISLSSPDNNHGFQKSSLE